MSKRNRNKSKVSDDKVRARQKASLKSMYFNRFLMVRYFLAVFFFSNFFWTALSWGEFIGNVALFMLLLAAMPVWEMGKMYGVTNPKINWTRFYFRLQWILCLAMCVLVWTAPLKFLYPFFALTTWAKTLGFLIPLTGLAMATACVRRINQIDAGNDRQMQRIQFFEAKYKLHI